MAVAFTLNGRPVNAGPAGTSVTLLQWLRGRGLTGTKEGCAEGECGACAVAMRRTDAHGRTRYEPINSCLVPLAAVHGETVVTVEGVGTEVGTEVGTRARPASRPLSRPSSRPQLHPVQQMMVEAGGSQCGYCTPGFVVSLFCEYYRPGRDGFDPEAISGNLCRCTGYRPIADVARAMPAPSAGDPHLAALETAVPPRPRVDTADGGERFVRPLGLGELFDTLAHAPGATLIAGGTDVMVGVTQKGDRPPMLVSLAAVPELRAFAVTADTIVLGAGLTLTEIEERLHDAPDAALPLLSQLLPLFSSRLIRNRATLGGNLMTASPIGDAPPVLLALDASVTLAGAGGSRVVPLPEFFLDYRRTAARPGEVLIDVRVPRAQPAIQRFYKVSKRVLDDISTVAAAFAIDVAPDGRVERARIAYGGIAATPLRATAIEDALIGQPWTLETASALRSIADGVGTPMTDLRGSAGYRRAMIGRLLEKCVADAANMAALVEAGQ